MDDIRKRIDARIKERNLDYKTVSEAIGRNHAYMQQYIDRGIPKKLKEDDRHKLAELLGFDESEISAIPLKSKHHKFDVGHADIHAGMGFGGAIEGIGEDEIIDGWRLPQTVKGGRRNLSTMRSIEVRGESMEPDIRGGSWVLVDTTQKIPEDDIYALDYGEGLLVKQVNLVPLTDEIDIVSKNPEHPNHRLKRDDVRIHGRVVGCFYWRG